MFNLRRASNHFRTRLHFGPRAAAAPPQSYHTISKSNNLHQIAATESNNFHQNRSYPRNLFRFRGFGSDTKEEEQQQEDEDDGEDLKEEEVRTVRFDLFSVVTNSQRNVYATLDKFTEEIKALDHAQFSLVLQDLSRCKMYEMALQLSNWLESKNMLNFEEERDYATRLNLIAKRRGIAMAEEYVKSIPEAYRGVKVYETLLCNYVIVGNAKKAEQVFERMRDLGFPLSGFACQQMILLYKKFDRMKIKSVLSLVRENDVKATRFTYLLLIDIKGEANDIAGMEALVEIMRSDGLEIDNYIRGELAKHYIRVGLNEKAGKILKEMEREDLEENHGGCKHLLPLYAALGKADEVERIWKVCESDDRFDDCLVAISAFGEVGRVDKAEDIFEKRFKSGKSISSKGYEALLNVYADHKLLAKCKDLVKRMASRNHSINRFVWDTLLKLCVDAGEVETADLVLQKAMQQMEPPLYNSFHVIMDQYSKRGDIHNTEKIFHYLKQSGYASKIRDYQSLLQAYVKAKVPAYGLRERMRFDNLFPNKIVAEQLAQIDSFKKTATSDLLD